MKLEHWHPEAEVYFNKINDKPVSHNKTRYNRKAFESQQVKKILTESVTSSDAKWMEMAKSLPKPLYDKVASLYKIDFDAFGYNPNEL